MTMHMARYKVLDQQAYIGSVLKRLRRRHYTEIPSRAIHPPGLVFII
jgi:hypothetical protein